MSVASFTPFLDMSENRTPVSNPLIGSRTRIETSWSRDNTIRQSAPIKHYTPHDPARALYVPFPELPTTNIARPQRQLVGDVQDRGLPAQHVLSTFDQNTASVVTREAVPLPYNPNMVPNHMWSPNK